MRDTFSIVLTTKQDPPKDKNGAKTTGVKEDLSVVAHNISYTKQCDGFTEVGMVCGTKHQVIETRVQIEELGGRFGVLKRLK